MKPRCDTCKFWDIGPGGFESVEAFSEAHGLDHGGHPDNQQGFCRRHAPHPFNSTFNSELFKHVTMMSWHIADPEQKKEDFNDWDDKAVHYGNVAWLTTDADDWCGEHVAKPVEPA